MINILDKNYFRYYGRILEKDGYEYLGYTNSQVDFIVKGNGLTTVTAQIGTNLNGEVNEARLRVFLDDVLITEEPIVLNKAEAVYTLASFDDVKEHKISLIKITEASMSYAKLQSIEVCGGTLLPLPNEKDTRMKVEFIGDSITCGYGVYGEPESEYHIREEDGMASYAYLTAKELNFNARYFSVSGYGVYLEWTGDENGVIPRVYPYTNWWADEEALYDFSDFIPELIVINLGTNDSGHMDKDGVPERFVKAYVSFLKFLKGHYPGAKILCTCGTLCTQSYEYVEEACKTALSGGLTGIYFYQQPYHNVQEDGIASGHPSLITHQKDARQLIEKIKEIFPDC
ncbi:SGNH/GDSL hydrolase family protein [Anaeromicropila populeti]|uniref:GDSL-like Lipase/Acylhydrolase family protein n=1 Tax=Anaeromicropila populeti TaxID=37658 RepID=A0A1I6KJ12_9FIRM|nr:SGNH/GDSL hydrolase family protein [Anaeromicropila populeti]SFR91232.1 GDSL-like Lipase/Acylhydrolase family protein [Anaeromicropila populeti]